ncbi:MAG TPA: L-2-hydroxyglutarate oxidase [Thermomicrobiales bacterium]|nr:L-2-hydroxyglutarate oxidase [Thermomicrobiales bacterium]
MATAVATREAPAAAGLNWRGDVVVIGAGIVGLAVAREWLGRRPGTRLIVLEKEDRIAAHQSGHNSGVIHSGIYYTPGSVKARACVAGAARMMRYCDEKGIPYRLCGKMIIATEEDELPRLEELHRRGIANEVPGLEMIGPERLREIEPHAVGLKALWSPNTGIVDYRDVAAAYADDVRQAGGEIMISTEVIGLERRSGRSLVKTTSGDFEARLVVACAGLWADRVAQLSGAEREPEIVPFRGDYYTLPPHRRHLVRTNIYPVPDPRFPFLGVHLTPRMNGEVWLGPNAVLAFARTGYRFTNVNLGDLAGIARSRGFRSFARQHWRTGLDEMRRDLSRRRFLASLQKFIPELQLSDLHPGPSGVRAQALSPDGKLVDDFVFNRGEGMLHVRNAPSPAATSSLEIGSMIADELEAIQP